LEDNPASLLRASDLVFVDPVGTGFSHALGEREDVHYWGVDEDADSIADLIRTWLTANRRWGSPRYLLGESYGTIRAALLVERLQTGYNAVFLNGVILVSAAMDMGTLPFFTAGNDFPFVGPLPSFAAAAWYHDALPEKSGTLEDFLEEVIAFASGEYLQALFAGDSLPEAEVQRIAERLHRYTGLDTGYLRQTRLRVSALRFTKELLRERGQTIGLLDSRMLGRDPDDAGEFFARDPSGVGVAGAFVAGIHRLLSEELEVEREREYDVLNVTANQRWRRPGSLNGLFSGFLATTPSLAAGASVNRDFRVMLVSGYHDLTTGFYAGRYMMNHSGIDRDRIRIEEYFGGHMMYLHPPSFERLSADLAEFVSGWR
jgi:carboxypeptidase C (cathepsin A)